MPQYDLYHETVKRALEKDGWRITDDPFTIMFEGLRLFADLGAERIFAAEREANKIVVEIKVLSKIGRLSEFEKALGQYFPQTHKPTAEVVSGGYRSLSGLFPTPAPANCGCGRRIKVTGV